MAILYGAGVIIEEAGDTGMLCVAVFGFALSDLHDCTGAFVGRNPEAVI